MPLQPAKMAAFVALLSGTCRKHTFKGSLLAQFVQSKLTANNNKNQVLLIDIIFNFITKVSFFFLY